MTLRYHKFTYEEVENGYLTERRGDCVSLAVHVPSARIRAKVLRISYRMPHVLSDWYDPAEPIDQEHFMKIWPLLYRKMPLPSRIVYPSRGGMYLECIESKFLLKLRSRIYSGGVQFRIPVPIIHQPGQLWRTVWFAGKFYASKDARVMPFKTNGMLLPGESASDVLLGGASWIRLPLAYQVTDPTKFLNFINAVGLSLEDDTGDIFKGEWPAYEIPFEDLKSDDGKAEFGCGVKVAEYLSQKIEGLKK